MRPTFGPAMARADVVFHAAGWYEMGVRDVRRMFDINVTGTGNVLSAARKENVPRVVYTGYRGGVRAELGGASIDGGVPRPDGRARSIRHLEGAGPRARYT